MASVLFNAAVLESQIASSEARLSTDSIINAVKGFQSAAGIFNFIKESITTKIVEKITPDISSESLECLETLMLAHAQQCIFEKSLLDKMKKDSVAKLGIGASNLYENVFSRMQSSALSGSFDKRWLGYAQGKSIYYRALSHYLLSQFHNDKDEKGIELSNLYKAKQLVDQVLNLKLPSELKQNCKDLLEDIKSAISKGVHENEKVYHDRVPNVEELGSMEAKVIAKSKIPGSLQELANTPDAFHELFPIPVMEAQQKFKEELNAKFASAFKNAREHRDNLKSKLAEKGLPGSVMANEKTPGFPEQVHKTLARVREQGGLNRLKQLRLTVQEMAAHTKKECNRLQEELQKEEQEDNEYRAKFQPAWTRLPSSQLTVNFKREIEKCFIKVSQASKTDEHIDDKISQNEEIFGKIVQPREIVDQLMPKPDSLVQAQNSTAKTELAQLLNKLDEYFGEESNIEKNLHHEKESSSESITNDLIQNQNIIDSVIKQHIQKFEDKLRDFTSLQEAEDQLFSQIINLHMSLGQNQTESKNQHERQTAVQRIFDAVLRYDEIAANLAEGVTFYTAMQEYIQKLGQRVEDFIFSRRTEAKDLIDDLSHIQNPMINSGSYYQPQPFSYNQGIIPVIPPQQQQYPPQQFTGQYQMPPPQFNNYRK